MNLKSFLLLLSLGLSYQSAYALAESVPGEYIVKLKNQNGFFTSIQNTQVLSLKNNFQTATGNFAVVRSPMTFAPDVVLQELKNNPNVEYAEPNYIYSLGKITKSKVTVQVSRELIEQLQDQNPDMPTDPKFSSQWDFLNLGATPGASVKGADIDILNAWKKTKGDRRIKVAIVDTGLDVNHPDLKEQVWTNESELKGKAGVDDDGNGYIDDIHGYNFSEGNNKVNDGHGHGTHCAGTVGAKHNNGVGIAGVMNDVTIIPVKFLSDSGSGTLEAAVKSIDYATKLGVDVMSNSWGGGGFSQALLESIKKANDAGIIFVAAAGNDSTNNDQSPHYPSNYEVANVVSVGAHDMKDKVSTFSNYGKQTVDVIAPGTDILSTLPGGKYEAWSGTSMATPHVSGIIGLLIAQEGKNLTPAQVIERIMKTSIPVKSYTKKIASGGRVSTNNFLDNKITEVQGPKETDWVDYVLPTAFESAHPYADNMDVTEKFKVEGAKYIRVFISNYELENNYDFVQIIGANGLSEAVTGKGKDYASDYVEGSEVSLRFISDRSLNKWGYRITKLQVVY